MMLNTTSRHCRQNKVKLPSLMPRLSLVLVLFCSLVSLVIFCTSSVLLLLRFCFIVQLGFEQNVN